MADIKFMLPDSLPLISANVLKAAGSQNTAATGSVSPGAAGGRFSGEVTAQQATDNGYRLTLKVDDKTLEVSSRIPLPPGTRLDLQVSDRGGKPVLQVTAVTLPETTPAAATGNTGTPPPAESGGLQSGLSGTLPNGSVRQNPGQPSQPPLTPPAVSGSDTLSVTESGLSSPKAAGPVSQAVIQLLSSRLPLLNSQPVADRSQQLYQPATGRPVPAAAPVVTAATSAAPAGSTPDKGNSATLQLLNRFVTAAAQASSVASAGASPAAAGQNLSPDRMTPAVLPADVRQILQQWQQQLPDTAQLQTPTGVQSAISNSGLNYEQKLFSLATRIRAQSAEAPLPRQNDTPAASSTRPEASASAAPPGTEKTDSLQSLFRSLWSRAAPAPASTAAPSPASATTLTEALALVQQRLESPGLHPQLSALLSHDHKAVLSRALLGWINHLQPASAQPVRDIPLSLPQQNTDTPEPFRLLQSALAQTETEQVARLQQGPDSTLNIPLYFRDGDQTREIRLQLQQDSRDEPASAHKKTIRWRLRLHFDLSRLGPMDVELDLSLPELMATFWSEQQTTLATLNHELQPLRARLQQMGVDVSELQARFGKLPETTRNQIRQRLVDTHS